MLIVQTTIICKTQGIKVIEISVSNQSSEEIPRITSPFVKKRIKNSSKHEKKGSLKTRIIEIFGKFSRTKNGKRRGEKRRSGAEGWWWWKPRPVGEQCEQIFGDGEKRGAILRK